MPITYGSVCSGIEAATVAWEPLGWQATWYAEIEPFPCAVLAHHYPETPNHGDMTRLAAMVLSGKIQALEVLVGGTPCQAFSVAGMREGLADPRGALTIKYVELLDAIDHVRTMHGQPEAVCLWENVPGVLSDKGNAFGCFLGALVGESEELQPPGGKWKDAGCVYGPTRTAAWRILDAQYFGLAQRRRRVFVVASARTGFDPLEVLFEREGVRRDTPPRRGEGQDLAGRAPFGPALQCGCGWVFGLDLGQYGCPNCEGDEGPAVEVLAGIPAYGGHGLHGDVSQAATLTAKDTRLDIESETFCVTGTLSSRTTGGGGLGTDFELAGGLQVSGTLQANGKAAGSATQQDAESGMLVVHGTQDPDVLHGMAHTLGRSNGQENALLAFSCKDHGADVGDLAPTLRAMGHGASHPNAGGQVAVCITGEITHTLKAEGFDASEDGTGRGQPMVREGSFVRRLTPRECERLQGFPDDHTLIPYGRAIRPEKLEADYARYLMRGGRMTFEQCLQAAADGPRYKAIGNSKAVFVVRWIGQRIQQQLERLA
ncbi:DNA cytosine methyltransferase [Pseudomonas putida]|uniref:DNA (cytosine-5-)-methyltransferase n=1 Tax=Pseudomonas putida TaxID=303 RepID=A0A1B2F6C9_PSEPU|nr:DNA cytosine methyltransferase [Pseudomonas putida]ANY87704.1 putative BsuMI modification methylase subunit YdiP [Pseudomonas putida]